MRLFTLGKLCERLQRPPGQIESAIRELSIVPNLELNDTAYYCQEDETLILELIQRHDRERLENYHRQQKART